MEDRYRTRDFNGPTTAGRPSENGVYTPTSSSAVPSSPTGGTMTRAERFEDEKKRIIQSCFTKKEPNGQLFESYITHIRVIEDAAFPSTPAPPNSGSSNKKPRLVIVAVRSTGRVRMHKARENANGTFSVGKTWGLEDLTAVQSFTSLVPTSVEEEKWKQWAGATGFVINITKPYYWEAGTAKEKEFFVQSLVKIYRKYTQGGTPQLIGFNEQERNQLLNLAGTSKSGGVKSAESRSQVQSSPGQSDGRLPSLSQRPSSPSVDSISRSTPEPLNVRQRLPSGPRVQSPTIDEARAFPDVSTSTDPPTSYEPSPSQQRTRQPKPRPSQEQVLQKTNERDIMRPYPLQTHNTSPSHRLTPESSNSELAAARANSLAQASTSSRAPSVHTGKRAVQESHYAENGDSVPQPKPSVQVTNMLNSTIDRWKPNGAHFQESSESTKSVPDASTDASSVVPSSHDLANDTATPLPERKRPPLQTPEEQPAEAALLPSPPDQLRESADRDYTAEQRHVHTPPEEQQRKDESYFSTESATEAATTNANVLARPIDTLAPSGVSDSSAMAETYDNTPTPTDETRQDEVHRPGLGPMFKKRSQKEIATRFRKAATAANAFKPRAGGAGERLMLNQAKDTNEPDGVSQVVPAPRRGITQDPVRTPAVESAVKERPMTPQTIPEEPQEHIPSPLAPVPSEMSIELSPATPDVASVQQPEAPVADRNDSKAPELQGLQKQRRRMHKQAKDISALEIDPQLLADQGIDLEGILSDFGWMTDTSRIKTVDALEAEIRRELARVEAGSWLGHLEHKDERAEAVDKLLDKAIAECDELEGLLTLYGVELSTLNEDIAFIEAQSQGLQVQTANQKLLQTELQRLVETISISPQQLKPLRGASIGSSDGLVAIESALLVLYKAMVTIDPALRHNATLHKATGWNDTQDSEAGVGSSELANMKALQEKRDTYLKESTMFLSRLRQHLEITLGAAFLNAKEAPRRAGGTQLDPRVHDVARIPLWQYSPVMLFARDMDADAWQGLIKLYEARAQAAYQGEFRDNIAAWKQITRKRTDESDLLFTTHDRESEGLTSTARKLTVKRSQTLAKSFRSASGDKFGSQDGKVSPYEAFAGALEQMSSVVFIEQNFIVEFFHATSDQSLDFPEAISLPPEARRATDLQGRKLYEPDRTMAKYVSESMEHVYGSWPADMQGLVDWALASAPMQGVGVIAALERKLAELEETNQEFLIKTLQKLEERLVGLFNRFVDEQIRAIEDTKVKIKKRKGVIGFMRTFPVFSAAIEDMLSGTEGSEKLEIRNMIDDAYRKINKAMFESLKVIAKESPTVTAGPGGDPEDKEALNYHVLMIDNMNHYIEEVQERSDGVLGEWRGRAMLEMTEHMEAYCVAVIRRPLGKLMEFLDSTDALLLASPDPAALTARPAHSRSALKKLLAAHDAKELQKGIARLKERIAKHFGDADEPALSRGLVGKVSKECEIRYLGVCERVRRLVGGAYEGGVEMGWGREDVVGGFRR